MPVAIVLVLLGIFMINFAGLRWQTGTDWSTYFYYFTMVDGYKLWTGTMEIGYEFLVRASRLIFGSNYTALLFIIAIILITTTYYSVYKLSPYPLFSLFLFISYSLTGSSFGVRQDMSICITLLSFIFIIERSFFKFAITLYIAFLFHKSAILFLPAYFVYNIKWNVITVGLVILVMGISLLMSNYLIQLIGPMLSEHKTELYLETAQETIEDSSRSLLKGLIGRSLILLLALPVINYGANEDKVLNGAFNYYIVGIVIFTIFTPINPVFSRMARPYDIFQILLIPYAYYNARKAYKIAIISVIFAFSIFKFQSAIRNDQGVFVPYKSVLD